MITLKKYGKALVCLFFLAILLLGVLTVDDYGRSWDEPGEMRIFRQAIMEYGEALPFETGFHKALGEMGIIPISQSIEMDHNFSLYYPIAWAACDTAMPESQFTTIWRVHTWLIFMLGLFSLYAICRRMGLSRPLCCLAVLLLLLSPRFFADGHYNNKDLALMTLTGLCLWQALRLAEKPCVSRGLLFALAAGMCVNTRIIGAAVCGLCGLLIVVRLALEKRLNRRSIGIGLLTVGAALVCYVLLTPALLNDPPAYLNYVVRNSYNFTRWNGTVLFMGQQISLAESKPPFYYLPVNILLTTPLLQLGLMLLGTFLILKRFRWQKLSMLQTEEGFAALLSALLWVLSLLGCVVLRVRVYNGWRHIYFIYIPMMLCAAYGLNGLWQHCRQKTALRRLGAGGLAVLLGVQGVLLCLNHPFQFAYYNVLVSRETIEERYDLDYWNLSMYQALEQLAQLAGDRLPIRVACTDSNTRSGYAMATTLMTEADNDRFELVDYDESQRSTFYLLANTSYQLTSGFQIPEDMEPVITIRSYGAELATIYACTEEKQP